MRVRSLPLLAFLFVSAALAQAAPTAFTYVTRSGVATNVTVTSEPKTVSGFTGELPVSVSGGIAPQYKVGSGAFTSAPGTIAAGQTLTVRHTSSSAANTESVTTVTVGEYSTPLRSVTGATDRTPDAFTFGEIQNTPPNAFVESAAKVLTGFNTGVPVVPGAGAQYRINGGSWTNASGTLNPDQSLQVRHLTASGDYAYTRTSVKVGGIDGTFTTRNRSSVNQAPTANAGDDQLVDENTAVTLDGSGSSDDGALTFAWTQTAGTEVALAGADTATPTFTAPDVTGDETLAFELTVTDAAGLTATDAVEVLVADTRVVSIAGATAQENAGTITFSVTVTPAAAGPITVEYASADGTALDGSDYTGGSGTLTIPAGGASATLVFPVANDALDEADETFTVGLTNPQGAQLGEGLATGTIVDDDEPLARFKVGTGSGDHNPTGRICIGGGSTNCGRAADPSDPGWIRDPLIARATAITGENGETFILVTTTNIGYFLAYKPEQHGFNGIYDVRLRIAAATGVPSTNITVVSDHSHNGPDTIGIWGGVSAEYMKITADAVVESAVEAWQSRRDAVIRVAAVNQNDDRIAGVPGLDSSYDLAPGNDLAKGNPYNEFRLLVADDADTGERILTFVNYAPHATVTNGDRIDGRYRLTGDWAAWAPQEAEALYEGFGLAAVGALGSTDWNKSGDVAGKEAEARSRLRVLMKKATERLEPVTGADVAVESTFIREQMAQPFLLLNYKPGLDYNNPDVPTDGFDVRIDRAVNPPFLTGTVVGTYVSAVRIGDVFLSTFPGEPFGELDHALQEGGRVGGARQHFLLGGANDFFGYMVKDLATYEQTARTGFHYLPGCEDQTNELETALGIRPEGEGACSDHWTLMVSPTIGSHIVCSLQDAADRLGFTTANRDAECPVLTALDGLAPPPESGDPATLASAQARETAVQQARALAEQCRGTAAPAALCDALAEGARTAETYLGVDAQDGGTAPTGQARAGVAERDASWHLGASAGQFAATGVGVARDAGFDPYGHSVRKVGSDILGTRIKTRALVVEGGNGKRVAIVANDLYLPNDLLHRRTAQLIAEHDALALATGGVVTGITEAGLAISSSHSHTSPFYSTPSWGTWIFQDVMDLRFFEYMARQQADAVIAAAADLRPVRMGGTTVHANDIQAHTYGPKHVRDGTPGGQPYDYTTQQVTVVSFDDMSTGSPRPYANWVIFGVHPEWVWGEEIVNGDITHATMRMLDRETGAMTVWSQRETGSSGPHKDRRVHDPSARREFQESNFAGYDRAARMLTDSIKRGLRQLAGEEPAERPDQFAAYRTHFDVASASLRFAPPVTRPYPGVSNCNTDRAVEDGEIGTPVVPGLPDCSYDVSDGAAPLREPFWEATAPVREPIVAALTEAGVPVPTSYSATSLTGVQETAAVHLQVFKLGSIAATMSPNEQFTSQVLNLESRLDKVPGNLWHGFDWACELDPGHAARAGEPAHVAAHCERQVARYGRHGDVRGDWDDADAVARARAQVHNDASGWELDPVWAFNNQDTSGIETLGHEYEPTDVTKIKGNFTHEEFTGHGYDLVVSVGMVNDYWGYMAEYREYRSHSDGYRKALNALGPHGADFVATRLARMAAQLNGAGVALPFNPLDPVYQAESVRAEAFARGMGEAARAYTAAYGATLPPDGGAPGIVAQPADTVKRFSAAVLKFIGGSNYTDLPNVRVERLVGGEWQTYGTQDGEVQLQLRFLPSLPIASLPGEIPEIGGSGVPMPDPVALAQWRAGQFEWQWTATFEAFVSDVGNLGDRPRITPAGTYRFVVDGAHRGLLSFPNAAPYRLVSETFEVVPWDGIVVEDIRVEDDGRVSFTIGPVSTHTVFMDGANTDRTVTRSPGYTVGPVDYPDSYEGGISWIRNERQLFAGEQQYCGRCTFRPWADSAQLAVPGVVRVLVQDADGNNYGLAAMRQGGRWITDGAIADGETAFVPAGTIVDENGEKNGADSAKVTRGEDPVDPPADTDGDGVIDTLDGCPTQAGPPSNGGCPVEPPVSGGFPLCEPVSGENYCLSDVPVVGAALQGAVDTLYDAVAGGGTPQNPAELVVDCTGPAGDPAPGTPQFAKRDADNIYCTTERHALYAQHPANNPYGFENYGADPYRAPARHAGKRFRHANVGIAGLDAMRGTSYSFDGAVAEVYYPCAAGTCSGMPEGLETFEPPYPVAIVMHGAASDKKHLEWATQPLAERGYFVLTANGTANGLPGLLLDWLFDANNPYRELLDLSRIGTAGHSLGAENATRVQGDARVSGIVAWDPCDGSGGNECRDSRGSRLHDKGEEARTPTLFLAADYLGFPGYPQPQVSVPGDLRVDGFQILRGNGVDTMLVTPRATTHLDWAGAFTFGNRLNEATSLYYTLSWFDRYVKARLVLDASGNVVPQQGRSEAEERAHRQAIADEAFGRLTAAKFDGMVDRHNLSQGYYDAAKAAASGDFEYGGNVPFKVKDLALADRLSFYHRSVCFISQPNLLDGDGTQVFERASTTDAGDMRKTGCPLADDDGGTGGGGPGGEDPPPDDSFPMCDPFFGTDYCVRDVPGAGPALQELANTVYDLLTGGSGGEPENPFAQMLANLEAGLTALAANLQATAGTLVAVISAPPAPETLPATVLDATAIASTSNPWVQRRPLNISHRGGEQDWPENTMFAYAESIRLAGSNMIEMDIYETADGELVVIHDDSVDRTTNGTGSVSSFTLAQLRALDAAHWFAHDGAAGRGTTRGRPDGEYIHRGIATGAKPVPADLAALGYGPQDFRIPTLREIFENPRFLGAYINIELKPDPDSTGQYEAKLAALIREYGRQDDVIVASFLDHNLALFQANAPEIATSVATAQAGVDKVAGTGPGPGATLAHQAYQVPMNFSGVEVVTAEYVADAHARGMAVHVWTVNDRADMVQLLNWCVDGIMTDRPLLLAEVMASGEASCPLDASSGAPMKHLVGSMHEHSGWSDGEVGKTPAHYFEQGRDLGLDFMAGSEHSDNAMLPVTANTDCLSARFLDCIQASADGVQKWSATAGIADAMNEAGVFTAIRGFEWTSDRYGHINVFFSQHDLNAKTGTGYAVAMEDFWQWLALSPAFKGGADGLVVFNHPGREDQVHANSPIGDPAYAWNDLAYRPEHDARVVGIEMYGKGGDYYDGDNNAPQGGWYAHALGKGWHVGPVGAEDEHGTAWARPTHAKTVVLAARNTRADLRAALAARRFYAVKYGHNDVRIDFKGDGAWLGSRLARPAGASVSFTVAVTDANPADGVAAARIEVVGPGGVVVGGADGLEHQFAAAVPADGEAWRFVRVLDAGGRVIAVSAPIWFRRS